MRKIIKVFIAMALALLLGVPGGECDVEAAAGVGELWQTFTVADGLVSGDVRTIFIAADGSIWLGTDAGVSHYDGRWTSLSVKEGLPAGPVRAIAQTKDGALWFATLAGLARRGPDGLCCDIWQAAAGLPSDDLHTLLAAAVSPLDGEPNGVWVGTAQGLTYVDTEQVIIETPVVDGNILAMLAAPNGELLTSVAGNGLWRRTATGQWQQIDTPGLTEDVSALWIEHNGRLWAGTGNGVVVRDEGQWRRWPLTTDDTGLAVKALLQDPDDGLWVATERGVFYAADLTAAGSTAIQFKAQQNSLTNDFVRALALDRDGALWLGTIGGLSRYAGHIWHTIQAAGLADQRVNALLADSSGRTWVGTEQQGLALWDGQQWRQFTTAEGLPDNRVITLFEDGTGRLWVATGTGVGYRNEDGSWRFFNKETPGLAGLPVRDFEQDTGDAIWLAQEGGLSRWAAATGFEALPELNGKRVNAVYRARDGMLWVGTQASGLLRLLAGQWQSDAAAGGKLPANLNDVVVGGIGELADGSLWVGTYNDGLWKYRSGRWERMDANLTSPKILTLSAAGSTLWVGTRQGAARFDGRTWQSYDGDVLPGAWVTAVASGANGAFWIGTTNGLVRYRPDTTPPWVEIDSVNLVTPVDGRVLLREDVLQALRVRGGDTSTPAHDLIYLTQLDTVDVTPLVHSDTQITSYSRRSLARGTYTLRVIARDEAFNYSQPAEVTIVVPQLITFAGLVLRADVFYPVAGLALLALAGLATASGVSLSAGARVRRLAAKTADRQRDALARSFNPYISGEPIRNADMFYGRDDLLRRIFNALHQNSIMIHGERRMGKTTLLYQLAEQLRNANDPEWVFVPVYVDLEGTREDRFFYLLMDMIWGALQAYLTEDPPTLQFDVLPPSEYSDREFMADLRLMLDGLKDVVAPRKMRVILLLDEMDVVSSYDTLVQQQLRRVFMSPLATNLGAVVAGIQISKAWDRVESPWYNLFNEIELEPFTAQKARELLSEPVRGIYEWEPEALEFVVEHAGGRPYRLQQYALEAVNIMLAAKRLRISLADVQAAHEDIERTHALS